MNKKILVTGVTGMDGSIISRLLITKGFKVYGMIRQSATPNYWRLEDQNLLNDQNFELIICDLTDCSGIFKLVQNVKPDWIINLGAMSEVGTSFEIPLTTLQVDAMGPVYFLEAIRQFRPNTRFYTAATSEIFGNTKLTDDDLLDENSKKDPVSPYASAKLLSYNMTKIYRESYNIFACSGILFNHSHYLRGDYFVEKKIAKYIALHRLNLTKDKLKLGNIYSKRDWGSAEEYMKGIILMMEQKVADDYVLATGTSYSIKNLLDEHLLNWSDFVEFDEKLYRPNELNHLLGDASKIRKLGWVAKKDIHDIMEEIIEYETKKLQYEKIYN